MIKTSNRTPRFRSRLDAGHAAFLDALGVPWEYQEVGYLADFYLPAWDVYLTIRADLPAGDLGETTPLGAFVRASAHLLARNQQDARRVRPRLYMFCGVPGLPNLIEHRGRWKLAAGCIGLQVVFAHDETVIQQVAWSDTEDWSLAVWSYYEGGLPATGRGQMMRSPLFPSGAIPALYVGSGRGFATPRLLAAYAAGRAACDAFTRDS